MHIWGRAGGGVGHGGVTGRWVGHKGVTGRGWT